MSFEFERGGIVYRVSTETPPDGFSRVVVQEQEPKFGEVRQAMERRGEAG